jgi:phospholipid-binding lipoprotein MlaA
MSFSALTTAMAVAAAPVPSGGAPASVASLGFGSVASDHAPPVVGPAAGSVDVFPSVVPAQSKEPTQLTESAQSMEPAQSIELASSAQPESQPPAARLGEIVVTGRRASPGDPFEDLNSTSFDVTQAVDNAIVAPVAFAYKEALPRPIRSGLRNFLKNLSEPIVFLNFMLQLKPTKAAETFGRFAINTTLGAAGLIDVAKRTPFNLPYRRNGFANTLGYYGVKPGPYFYLPLVGSTTLRDFIGNRLDLLILPMALGRPINRPKFAIPAAILGELDHRIEFDDELRKIRATGDPYVATRTYYLRKRQAEIDALQGRGDSTIRATVPARVSSDPTPAPNSPAPAEDRPPRPNFNRQ